MTTYVKGRCKEIDGKFGKFLSIGIHIDEINKHLNDKGYFDFTICPRKEVDKYDNTHSIIKNDYTPKEAQHSKEVPDEFDRALDRKKQADKERADIILEDLPF